jgi:hypothetical protein|tara:strand:+ start:3651 stop:4304 length:654 start_codon:yes stop_codon:yes gene_type:complete
MIIPFIPEDLFELNNNIQPKFDKEVIVIDNVFKNYQNILDICYNLPVEQWKTSSNSRNFKDYYDCRPRFSNWFPNQQKIQNRLSTLLSITNEHYNLNGDITSEGDFNFNYFKHLKQNVSKDYQQYPHYDEYFNVIFYIDPFENGGTALYENINLQNKEEENLLFNISNLKIENIVNSKPNRCVIFPGYKLHGGYIENHDVYYYNWRINLVHFFKKSK